MPDGSQVLIRSVTQDVLAGLGGAQKTLPAKLFYDPAGCLLFDQITRLPEYYLTRCERALLIRVAPTLPALPGCALVEFGGSDEAKAMMLLEHIAASSYVPIDVAASALSNMASRLAMSRPKLSVYPIAADFLAPLSMPPAVADSTKIGFFPGSTIGNLHPDAAQSFLARAHGILGASAKFLIGVDLRKDPAILLPAYDDAEGVTAAFNLNILNHLNRDFGADFDVAGFEHRAIWNDSLSRVEMHLMSRRSQSFQVANTTIHFAAGETIHTENSYKYTVEAFKSMAALAGWSSQDVWTDEAGLYSVHLLATT